MTEGRKEWMKDEKKGNKGRREIEKKEMKKNIRNRKGEYISSISNSGRDTQRCYFLHKHLVSIIMTVTFCYLKIQLKLTIRLSNMTRDGNRSICTMKRFVSWQESITGKT
jgi:hypothetical protein